MSCGFGVYVVWFVLLIVLFISVVSCCMIFVKLISFECYLWLIDDTFVCWFWFLVDCLWLWVLGYWQRLCWIVSCLAVWWVVFDCIFVWVCWVFYYRLVYLVLVCWFCCGVLGGLLFVCGFVLINAGCVCFDYCLVVVMFVRFG